MGRLGWMWVKSHKHHCGSVCLFVHLCVRERVSLKQTCTLEQVSVWKLGNSDHRRTLGSDWFCPIMVRNTLQARTHILSVEIYIYTQIYINTHRHTCIQTCRNIYIYTIKWTERELDIDMHNYAQIYIHIHLHIKPIHVWAAALPIGSALGLY